MSWIAEAHERAAEGHLKECCERIVKALGRMIPFYRVFSSSPRLLGAHLEFSGALGTYRVAEGLGVEPREVARDFARRVLGAGADAWDEAGEYPLIAFREAAALGLAGLFVPVADGGQGQDGLTGGLILEQLAQGCFATTFGLVVHNNFAGSCWAASRSPSRTRARTRPRSRRRPRRSGAATGSMTSRPG